MREDAASALAVALRSAVRGAVLFDAASRAVYSADASNYRHVPVGVVQPVDAEDVLAALEVCRRHDAPVLPRGAGTSLGGQAVNVAVVLDLARHLDAVLEVDPAARRARVQPGVVLDALQAATAPYGLAFGPDPASHSRCTLGGMIGNNACGAHSVAWGKTVDNVAALDVVAYDGTRLRLGPIDEPELARRCTAPGGAGRIHRDLRRLRDAVGDAARRDYPELPRRVSGYNLDQLAGERGFDLARALVGTEGTCATVLEATVDLVAAPPARALAVLGFPDLYAAADAVMPILEHRPLTVEGLDAGVAAALRAVRPQDRTHELLPPGGGWLYVETGGGEPAEAEATARAVARTGERAGAASAVVSQPAAMRALWRVREERSGIVSRGPDGGEAWPGWEDAAVPPERLGSYLREFDALLRAHGRRGACYGHFGDGCLHVRIDFDLRSTAGLRGFRAFMQDAADLVVSYGGSLSGEHGDGQARSELLPRMYPPRIIDAFAAFKTAWDPDHRMNPERIVAPAKLDEDMRVFVAPSRLRQRPLLAFSEDRGSFAAATRRCVGIAKCVTASGGVMCPSYRATREERHSTRGRARLLFEMASGQLVRDAWRSPEVHEALDLCLSCKGCKRDCPVGVDMAAYKAEFLAQRYAGRLRPIAHYSMGALPRWLRLLHRVPGLPGAFNAVLGRGPLAAAAKRAGGIDPRRQIPPLAPVPLTRRPLPARPEGARSGRAGAPPRVLLWPDTFTNFFDPQIGTDAAAVLTGLGLRVELPAQPVCCGLTCLSTGQIGTARRVLARSLDVVAPWLADGVPVICLEPSCTALLRADVAELLPHDPAAARLSAATRTFAELLAELLAEPPAPPPGLVLAPRRRGLVQIHCHQYAELGFDADAAVLDRLGVDAEILDSGCCGMAGGFGFERGHYDVSMACAERVLLPAIRAAGQDVDVLADGFSCRTQIRQATGREPLHLAQLAARASRGSGSIS